MNFTNIPKEQIIKRIRFENPWWKSGEIDSHYDELPRRLYFELFQKEVDEKDSKPIVMFGLRGVGKTAMTFHTIKHLIGKGVAQNKICYISIEIPIFNKFSLDELFELIKTASGSTDKDGFYLIFEEIQYIKNWENELHAFSSKNDSNKVICSSSVAIQEKGKRVTKCKRFRTFFLPVLTFYEYLELKNQFEPIEFDDEDYNPKDIEIFNKHFLNYINYGSYSKVVLSKKVDFEKVRFENVDYIDKVLLVDLPHRYGINKEHNLNALITLLAYNSGVETSIEQLSKISGLEESAISKYLTYLENSFLIKTVHRIGLDGKKEKDNKHFKIYLTSPSLRTALFVPTNPIDKNLKTIVETSILSQWQHIERSLIVYAKWEGGEIDFVKLDENENPVWVTQITGDIDFKHDIEYLDVISVFCKKHNIPTSTTATYNFRDALPVQMMIHSFEPACFYSYTIGKQIIEDRLTENYFNL